MSERIDLTLRVATSLHDVSPEAWDACAGPDNPFVRHGFLSALEDSRSACAEAGWAPHHLLIEDGARLLGCVPLYLKNHSYGEYVFDWGWAEAYERAGGRYYPKLQCAVPFTPVTGPRLLVHPAAPPDIRPALARALVDVAKRVGVSSLHVTFCTTEDLAALKAAGCLPRVGLQFHWDNPGYGGFDDFLAALSSRKRKDIRKERQRAAETGLTFRTLTGAQITPDHWRAFYRFYRDTTDRKWGDAYLTPEFFPLMADRLGDAVVLMWAEQHGQPAAAALNLRGADCLYGRNWGSSGDWRFLHFELCYYQALDYAIAHKLPRVEAGAQGEHKLARGYLPRRTYSAHWIRDDGFRAAVEDFLDRETRMVERQIADQMEGSPYRQS